MLGTDKSKKNFLSIRLAESAVFLRTDTLTLERHHRNHDSRPSMLRGLLTLELAKPTRITSIEVELTAKSCTSWPEGIGARRIDVSEEHVVFHGSTVFFQAKGQPHVRRTASIGPGTSSINDEPNYHDFITHEDVDEDDDIHYHGSVIQGATPPRVPPHPIPIPRRGFSTDSTTYRREVVSHQADVRGLPSSPPYAEFPSPIASDDHLRVIPEDRPELGTSLSHSSIGESSDISTRSRNRRSSFGLDFVQAPLHFLSVHRNSDSSPPPSSSPPRQSPSPNHRRTGSRFSLSSVSTALRDVVRPAPAPSDVDGGFERGRAAERGHGSNTSRVPPVPDPNSKEGSTLTKLGNYLRSTDDSKTSGEGWKEFKKGTYTYPISFEIPGSAPPSLRCAYGSVTWRLRAVAHRPGTFSSRLAAVREVNVIAAPSDDDTEDTESVVIERQWDQQLQYILSISGRSFYLGGTIPMSFVIMPLTKVKIHRFAVLLEERVDYYANMKRLIRTDPPVRVTLLSIRTEGKSSRAILPLESEDVNAFRESPLFQLARPEDDVSELASTLFGPGPWTFHQNLQLPVSCTALRFTNKNRRSNIIISHLLKCIIRVERGDEHDVEPKTGKKKLFDIVIQMPVIILSHRCNPDWIALPPYSEPLGDSPIQDLPCPSSDESGTDQVSSALERRISTDSMIYVPEPEPFLGHNGDSLMERNTQYERLVSGQESELGEAPPAYDGNVGRILVHAT